MIRVLTIVALALAFTFCRAADTAPDVAAATAHYLAPYAPVIKTIGELQFQYYTPQWDQKHTIAVYSAEWEIRDADHPRRIALFPAQMYFEAYNGFKDLRPPHEEGAQYRFVPDQLAKIGELGPGNYVMALLVNGVRASNVMPFKIDPGFDPKKAPALTCGMMEAPPGQATGELLAWAVGPTPEDPQFTNMAVTFPDITVDGKVFKNEGINWDGPVGPYHPGQQDVRVYYTKERLKEVDLAKPHDFSLRVLDKYSTATVRLNLGSHALAKAWDEETANLNQR
jgi:hypothetical protein